MGNNRCQSTAPEVELEGITWSREDVFWNAVYATDLAGFWSAARYRRFGSFFVLFWRAVYAAALAGFVFLECGGLTPLWIVFFMVLSPRRFRSQQIQSGDTAAFQQRIQSGDTSPHSKNPKTSQSGVKPPHFKIKQKQPQWRCLAALQKRKTGQRRMLYDAVETEGDLMAKPINHDCFITLLTERFPEVAADIDDCARGLLHLEMATG